MTQVQQTSLSAYQSIRRDLGRRQNQVFNVFLSYPNYNYTNTEISRVLGLPINQITPRVYELRRLGLLVEATRRSCLVTGRTCIAWRLNKELEI